ncbi:MAG: DUF4012 domain-containing protein [Candidatus Kerfeldbacteria bacterium]
MQNLLDKHPDAKGGRWKRMAGWKKFLIYFGSALAVLAIALAVWGAININRAKVVYDESLAAKQSIEYAQTAVANQDFDLAASDLEEAKEHFDTALDNFARFRVYKIIPGLAEQIKAVDNILLAGKNLSSGLQKLVLLVVDINDVIEEKEGDISFGDITAEEKRNILKKMSESPADLQGLKSEIELAVFLIDEIPEDGLFAPIREAVEPVKEQLPLLEAVVNQLIPAAQSLPTIAGYPNEKTYLFLLQNNRELRPTGGFIGTYGILKLKDAEIQQFTTDNIYNLDNQGKDTITEPAPAPIAKHTSTQNWLLRDINWSPDFPATAKKAEEKYHEEGGTEQHIDGVIAVTPTFIESLLDITGPLTVDGVEFNSENLFETLEYQVEFGYYEQGISDAERKEVIGDLSSRLMDELFALPRSELSTLWETFVDAVDSKQILVYVDDPITQSLVLKQNWAGEMKVYDGDYLMFVDANLAALKTDAVLERDLSYSVNQFDGEYYGTAEMHYENTGWFSGFHTRYRTHTRIYLPLGSEVVEWSGFMTGDKTQNGVATDPEIYEESFPHADGTTSKYTVVGGFTSIEPQTGGTLRIKYKLPESVVAQINAGTYKLYVQKQAGTLKHGLNVSFDIGRKLQAGSPLDKIGEISENSVSFSTDLHVDRKFMVTLE